MKSAIRIVLMGLSLVPNLYAYTDGDDRGGNGGGVVVCDDSATAQQSTESLDLYRGREDHFYTVDQQKSEDLYTVLNEGLRTLHQANPAFAQGARKELRRFARIAESRSHMNFDYPPKFSTTFVPIGCKSVMVVNWREDIDVAYVNWDLYPGLSGKTLGTILLHEIISAYMRTLRIDYAYETILKYASQAATLNPVGLDVLVTEAITPKPIDSISKTSNYARWDPYSELQVSMDLGLSNTLKIRVRTPSESHWEMKLDDYIRVLRGDPYFSQDLVTNEKWSPWSEMEIGSAGYANFLLRSNDVSDLEDLIGTGSIVFWPTFIVPIVGNILVTNGNDLPDLKVEIETQRGRKTITHRENGNYNLGIFVVQSTEYRDLEVSEIPVVQSPR